MVIKDLFSHKIHSSGADWPEKLIDIATIFSEFDGEIYNRDAIERRLTEISPRATSVPRDPSKFRDEISAYPAYLGLYRIELHNGVWRIFLSQSAKSFLICEEPNVPAFLLLQLSLFQYPNGMGAAYQSNSNTARIQANTRIRTLDFVNNGVHISPLRLICQGLVADSTIREVSALEGTITLDEIFVLANNTLTNQTANPDLANVLDVLYRFRAGEIEAITGYESRFHILNHTNFLESNRAGIKVRSALGEIDKRELLKKLNTICNISTQFNEYDHVTDNDQLVDQIKLCSWGKYFDGVRTLDSGTIELLTGENPLIYTDLPIPQNEQAENTAVLRASNIYELKPFNTQNPLPTRNGTRRVIYADPELTRIKRQRANLTHKILIDKLRSYLEARDVNTFENEHIDLFAKLNDEDKFLFEVKSINDDNLLSQTRKGISQLYEYRYRYQDEVGYGVKLFLVFPMEPSSVTWLQEYVCSDREIGVIWFTEDNELHYSEYCTNAITPLLQLNQ